MATRSKSLGIWSPDSDTPALYGEARLERPPIKLMLSLVERCNLRCFHCLGSSTGAPDAMSGAEASTELIDFIVDRIVPSVRAVRLGGLGTTEQLIAPGFDHFMARMADHALDDFQLTTNLSVMTPARAEILARTLTDIEVSLEGIGPNFEWARRMKWEKFVKNLGMVVDAKRKFPASRMRIELLVTAIPRHFDDLLNVQMFRDMGIERILLRSLHAQAPEHHEHVLSSDPEKTLQFCLRFRDAARAAGMPYWSEFEGRVLGEAYGQLGKALAHTLGMSDTPPVDRPVAAAPVRPDCHLPFETMTINADGHFGACCTLSHLLTRTGSPANLDIMAVWNSDEFAALRHHVNSSHPKEPCLSCPQKAS